VSLATLLSLGQRLGDLQRTFRDGAPVSGSQVFDLASDMVALVALWEFHDS
jgi:hypothetical protein